MNKPRCTAPVRRGAALAARLGCTVAVEIPESAGSTESFKAGKKDLEAFSRYLTTLAAHLGSEKEQAPSPAI